MPQFTRFVFLGLVSSCLQAFITNVVPAAPSRPNIVILLTDDQGYADVGTYGAEGFSTPRLDRMAQEGMRFTDFYATAPVCSASRAALLTGCYAQRISIPPVVTDGIGLNPDETTLPELLRPLGYATAIVGKWHLGQQTDFLPLQHGFDEFFGTPYSNDMGPDMSEVARRTGKTGLPLIEGNETVEVNPDQRYLTRRYTERAVDFIQRHREQPFFLYVAYNMPHTPLFASERFAGKSARGLYGDVIAEIDWSVGAILDQLKAQGLDENTLVVFSSDNGPWRLYGDHGGSAGPLRGGKKQTFDGGLRVPCLMRWPGRIPAGASCNEVVANLDLLPTVAKLVGAPLPPRPIDGLDVTSLLFAEPGARSPHAAFFYYWRDELRAVRSGKWKLQFPHVDSEDPAHSGMGGKRGTTAAVEHGLAIYDLENDIGETTDLALGHSQVVTQLTALAEVARREMGDSLTGRKGTQVRPAAGSRKE